MHPGEDRSTHDAVPDVEFLDRLNRRDRRDVKVGEAVTGMHSKSDSGAVARRVLELLQRRGALAPGVGVATGMQLDGGNAEFPGPVDSSRGSGR